MKTSFSNLIKSSVILAILFTYGTAYGQKSINYRSVGSQLDEISNLFDDSCKKIDKVSTEVINDLETFVKKNTNSETIAKVTDWSEVQLKELNDVVTETKIWLSKQHFGSIKHAKKQDKDLAKKE